MRLFGPSPSVSFLFFCVSAASAWGAPVWGTVQNDLQLGIEWGQEPTQAGLVLRISIRNVGANAREIPIGFDGSAGPVYDVKIVAARSGQPGERTVLDLNGLKAKVTSFPAWKSIRLGPGATSSFDYPIEQLIYIEVPQDKPLQELINHGYSVRASISVSGVQIETPDLAPAR